MKGRLERKIRGFFKLACNGFDSLACKGLALPFLFVSSCSNNNVLMVLHFNNRYLLIFPLFCVSFCKV